MGEWEGLVIEIMTATEVGARGYTVCVRACVRVGVVVVWVWVWV